MYILGLQIGAQFCPGMIYRKAAHAMARQTEFKSESKLSFFVV